MTDYQIIKLNHPTSSTEQGPFLTLKSNRLVLEYDWYDEETKEYKWEVLVFEEVLKVLYKQAICCDGDDIDAYNQIISTQNSKLWSTVIARWEKRVGWHKFQKEQGGKERFKHYKIYFDDAGCVDVIASKVTFENPHKEKS